MLIVDADLDREVEPKHSSFSLGNGRCKGVELQSGVAKLLTEETVISFTHELFMTATYSTILWCNSLKSSVNDGMGDLIHDAHILDKS